MKYIIFYLFQSRHVDIRSVIPSRRAPCVKAEAARREREIRTSAQETALDGKRLMSIFKRESKKKKNLCLHYWIVAAAAATLYYTKQTEALGRCDVITNASSFVFVLSFFLFCLSFFGACVCVCVSVFLFISEAASIHRGVDEAWLTNISRKRNHSTRMEFHFPRPKKNKIK